MAVDMSNVVSITRSDSPHFASADSALAAGAPLPPGVEVQHVPGGNPTVSWRGEDDARELLEDMQSRGLFTLSTALRLKELT